jgi:heme/copper-type cytochrome/quinol oxidase subunit 2
VKRALRTGVSGVLLILIMLLGGLFLWVGMPVGWLYIGSQVQGSTDSLATAIGVMMLGVIASIAIVLPFLGWLNHKHAQLREARGLDDHGQTALEAVMTVSAGIALLAFGLWFFLFSGASPLPVGLGGG